MFGNKFTEVIVTKKRKPNRRQSGHLSSLEDIDGKIRGQIAGKRSVWARVLRLAHRRKCKIIPHERMEKLREIKMKAEERSRV